MNRRILILDDEPGLLDAYRIILSPAPSSPRLVSSRRAVAAPPTTPAPSEAGPETFDVTYVSTGLDALAKLEEGLKTGNPFVGGFFDVKLGEGIDGIETLRRAKDLDPNLLAVMVTAYQDRSIDEISRIFGDDFADRWDFLTKPFSHNEILQKARNLVSNWDRRKREKEYLERIQTQQEQLVRSERLAAVGTLARGIGHEFGNILMRLIGMAEIAAQKADPENMRTTLKTIASAAERAGVIVRNLQTLVKIEAKRDVMDVHEAINDALPLVEHELKKANVTLVKQLQPGSVRCSANRVEIGQVFLNLIINAIHAMEDQGGGTLTIKSSTAEGGLLIEVSDTGHGITPENMTNLFEPLFTTKGPRGTGIGLSVSKKIMTNHAGKIDVVSVVGKGTTFRLWLPYAPAVPQAAAA